MLPAVPIRQWVLTLPYDLRMLCAFRPEAISLTVRGLIRAVFAFYRRRARVRGLGAGRCGAVTVVQRAGSACELNVHLHVLVLDGVYVDEKSTGRPGFRPFPAPTTRQLQQVVQAAARKIRGGLQKAGLAAEQTLPDAATTEPELAELVAESVAFPRGRVVDPSRARQASDSTHLATAGGFNLHAGVTAGGLDVAARERLCRYLLRPPISDERLTLLDDGRVELALKTPWRDGTVALRMTPEQLVARLAALVPRPEKNLIRYHGVLAPAANDRALIVPRRPEADAANGGDEPGVPGSTEDARHRSGNYLLWAELLRRVFQVDVDRCPRCGGQVRLICAVVGAWTVARYLRRSGTGASPPAARARPPPNPGPPA